MNNIKLKTYFTILLVTCFCANLTASQLDTLIVLSKSMNKNIPNLVITPDNYVKQNKKLPVLYLLHGAGGDYASWTENAPIIKKYSDEYNIIIVCPDGGFTSWYFDSPIDNTMKYETYISKELIEAIDEKYYTIPKKGGRAITGLSMGGHGALYLSIRHQDVWGATGSSSGGVDIRPFPNNWDIYKRLGPYSENEKIWEENTVINLVDHINSDLRIIIDCGYNDFFYDANKRLHEKLLEQNIAHDYIERPGAHNWNYWTNAIQYQTLFFNNFFNGN